MSKKRILAFLFAIVLTLTVFCGCNNSDDTNTEPTATAAQTSDAEVSEPTDSVVLPDNEVDADKPVSSNPEYVPEHKDENELEIMTAPEQDSDSQDSADSQTPTIPHVQGGNDVVNSGEKIELPFVPVQ